jgi:hypothetical protein
MFFPTIFSVLQGCCNLKNQGLGVVNSEKCAIYPRYFAKEFVAESEMAHFLLFLRSLY